MIVQAEVSLYPLGRADLAPEIVKFIDRLKQPGVEVEPGPMSTRVHGEAGQVFAALQEAFTATAGEGRCALVVKLLGQPEEPVARRMA